MNQFAAILFCLLFSLGCALTLLAGKCAAADGETIMSLSRSGTFAHEFVAADLLGLNRQELAAAVSRWNEQPGELRCLQGIIRMGDDGNHLSYKCDQYFGYTFQLQFDETGKVCALRRGIGGCTNLIRYTRWMSTRKAALDDDRKLTKHLGFGDITEKKLNRHFPYSVEYH